MSTSLGGGSVPPGNIVAVSDYVLLHGNGVRNPEQMEEMIRQGLMVGRQEISYGDTRSAQPGNTDIGHYGHL